MDIDREQLVGAVSRVVPRRSGRVHPWVIAAIGVHFLLATVAVASDASVTTVERTKVRRISESVVQVIRELVDRHARNIESAELRESGFRVVESGVVDFERPVPIVRMLSSMLTDLPPPLRA